VKLLLDQGLPRGAVAELRALGLDAAHVSDLGMASATDSEIIALARADGLTVVTLDADFHALLALSDAVAPSVVRVRIEGLRSGPLSALIVRVVTACRDELLAGAMVTVDDGSVRIRALPLIR
jgi:predicted nuclease of predicted toxin-antitoxin system